MAAIGKIVKELERRALVATELAKEVNQVTKRVRDILDLFNVRIEEIQQQHSTSSPTVKQWLRVARDTCDDFEEQLQSIKAVLKKRRESRFYLQRLFQNDLESSLNQTNNFLNQRLAMLNAIMSLYVLPFHWIPPS